MRKRLLSLLALVLAGAGLVLFAYHPSLFPGGDTVVQRLRGKATVADRLAQYGPPVHARLHPYFGKQGVAYPPQQLVLLGIKQDKRLQIYAAGAGGPLRFIREYPILAASGRLGPKLREGDLQVPEGLYRIESLNPNSAFHLALRVNYPNEFDHNQAAREGRTNLGQDIMIHGNHASVGCLAVGDEAAEDLFVLAAETGIDRISVILTPVDFREATLPPEQREHLPWLDALYGRIKSQVMILPRPA